MDKEMSRGDTMLISIDAPTEYPVTTLRDVIMSIKQGHNETLIPLSEFQLVTIPETGKQEYQYVISQKMSLGFEETRKHGYKVEISLVWLNQTGTRRQDPHKTVYEVNPTIYDDVMSGDSPIEPPDDYSGATEVTPSTETQVLPTKNKIVLDDITIYPAPTESLATNENGTFLPSFGSVGFSEVVVDVEPSLESLSVTENGLYLPESGTDGFDRVNVNVPIPTFKTEEKTVTENGIYLPSAGVDGISKVTVDVPETIPDLIPLTATANGQYTATGHDGFSDVTVDVPSTVPVLQGKAVNPSETAQHVEPDSGYDGLSAVDVGAIPSSYVGSGITRRSGSDLTASGNTVNVPSGYYAESGSKSVQSGTAGTPTASKGAVSNHSIAVTPSVSNTEGYISGGTLTGNAITVSASELVSGTKEVSITSNGTTTEDVTAYANAQITVNVVNEDYEDALVALGVTEDLTDGIEALTAYANTVTGESDTTLSDAVASLVDGYGQGGGISDGYEITALDQDGFPTAVDHYGTEVHRQQYWNRTSSDGFWKNLVSITFKDVVTSIGASAFYSCVNLTTIDTKDIVSVQAAGFQSCTSFTSLDFPKLTSVGQGAFLGCTAVINASFPVLTNCSAQRVLRQCLALEDVQLGSVGYGVTSLSNLFFEQDTQTGLTITIYTTGSYADAAVTNARNSATNATIVIKASEATTYNGTSYSAGDTILTSTP